MYIHKYMYTVRYRFMAFYRRTILRCSSTSRKRILPARQLTMGVPFYGPGLQRNGTSFVPVSQWKHPPDLGNLFFLEEKKSMKGNEGTIQRYVCVCFFLETSMNI